MKTLFLSIALILISYLCKAQAKYADSLQHELSVAKDDTTKVLISISLSQYYSTNEVDSSFYFAQQAVKISQKANYKYGEALGIFYLASAFDKEGNYAKSLDMAYRCLEIAEKLKYGKAYIMSLVYFQIGLLNRLTNDNRQALVNHHYAISLYQQSGKEDEYLYHFFAHLGATYEKLNLLDSALFYTYKGYNTTLKNKQLLPYALLILGRVYDKKNDTKRSEHYYRLAIQTGKENHSIFFQTAAQHALAIHFRKTGAIDSCLHFAKEVLQLSLQHRFSLYTVNASTLLMQVYDSINNRDSTLKYMKTTVAIKDSVFSQAQMQQFQVIASNDKQRRQKMKTAEERYKNQVRIFSLMTALMVFLLLAFILYRNNKQKQKANLLLQQQKEEIQSTLFQLKSTQSQLIQSEKMASLGELTAGIAHEIQNPLNFVNNFSEVNKELLLEMKDEIDKGNTNEAKLLVDDLINNQEKINQHGKRADAIVKGMLQHSRSSSGQKEPTDINALADEYLRLSFHGLRAKDKSFNATMETHFDENLQKIAVTPQDIGRVLLNLYNNAFYAVSEKKKLKGDNYKPTVSVSTKKIGDKVEIKVSDNGNGIPQKVLDKIFQPFFTTKPTGQGTGLGLSLSYDIIKSHGGEIKVETKVDEGRPNNFGKGKETTFIIHLPVV